MNKSNIEENKAKEQEIVKAKFRQANYVGTYLGATGVGKTKIGIDLLVESIKENPEEQWFIIIPTRNLRDNEWRNEFIKWGYGEYLNKVKIICINTAYKLEHLSFNAVIDEVHTTMGPKYRQFYTNNKISKLMCFTATIDNPDNYAFVNSMAPILHKTDINQARALNLVSPYYVFNLEIQMCEQSQKQYSEILHMYNYYESLLGGPLRAFSNAGYIIKQMKEIRKEDRTVQQKDLLVKATNYWRYMQKRKSFLYNCKDKIEVTKQLLQKFSDRKALVFSETIDFAKQINKEFPTESVIFHSLMSERAKKDALLSFQSDLLDTRIISAVRALNAGFNVPSCSLGICASGNSKWLDFIQRQGRVIRKTDDKIAIFVNLYIAGTQEAKWVLKRTKIINPNYLKWIKTIQEITI